MSYITGVSRSSRVGLCILAFTVPIVTALFVSGNLSASVDARATMSLEDSQTSAEQREALGTEVPAGTDPMPAGMHSMHMADTTADGDKLYDSPIATTVPNQDTSAVLQALTPAQGGRWTKYTSLPKGSNAYHMIMGPKGKILLIAGSGNSAAVFKAGTFKAYIWSPTKGITKTLKVPKDMFCAGHMLLSNGKGLAAGGTTDYSPWKGSSALYTFDFTKETFTRQKNMAYGRWYPTLIGTPTGSALIVGGYDGAGKNSGTSELFDPTSNTISKVAANQKFALYPEIYTTSDNRYFNTGAAGSGRPSNSVKTPGFWDPFKGNIYTPVPGMTEFSQRRYGTSCRIGDVRNQDIIVMGGGWPATASTNIINLNETSPTFRLGPSLASPKAYANCVALPGSGIIEIGGGSVNKIANASREVAMLTSATASSWTTMNPLPAKEHRLYHSLAYLQDDGSIISMNSDPKGEPRSNTVLRYEPPYLFQGARPTITSAPATMTYGKTYTLSVSSDVTKVSIMPSASPTHGTDSNQKQVILPVVNGKITLDFNSYQFGRSIVRIFALNAQGTPSVAAWSKVE